MKKVFILLLLITVFIGSASFLAFTTSGNALLLPFINGYLKKSVEGTKVELVKLELKPSHLSAFAKVNDVIDIDAKGPVDLIAQSFDLQYSIDAQKIQSKEITIDKPIHVSGEAKGQMDDMHISGSGKAFASDIHYTFNLLKNRPQNIRLDLKDASIAEMLAVMGEKPYVKGLMSLDIDMPALDAANPQGQARLQIKNALIDEASVKRAYDISLPPNTSVKADITATAKDKLILAKGAIITSLAKLDMSDITYEMTPGVLRSDYHIYVPDLSKLEPLTQKRFRGDMDFRGQITKAKDLVITGQGKEFDGSVAYKLINDNIRADVHGATVSKVMYMLGYPQVLEALSEAKVDYNFSTKSGKVDAKLDSARILSNQLTILLKQLTGIDLTQERYNQATFVSTLTPAKINFDFIAQNINSHFKIKNGVLDRKSEQINASVDMKYKDKDLKATISGTIENPKVNIDASEYLKSKVGKEVDKVLEEKIKGKKEEKIKGLLKGIF